MDERLHAGSVWVHHRSELPPKGALERDLEPSPNVLLGEVQRVADGYATLRCLGQTSLLTNGEKWTSPNPEAPAFTLKWARVPVEEFGRSWRFLFQGERPN